MAIQPDDWHPEQIKAAIRMRGVSLKELALRSGYDESAVRQTLRYRWTAIERIVADFLGCRPQDIWPSRYDRAGNPVRRHRNGKRDRASRVRQKSEAA